MGKLAHTGIGFPDRGDTVVLPFSGRISLLHSGEYHGGNGGVHTRFC
jgi:hypothetical protein